MFFLNLFSYLKVLINKIHFDNSLLVVLSISNCTTNRKTILTIPNGVSIKADCVLESYLDQVTWSPACVRPHYNGFTLVNLISRLYENKVSHPRLNSMQRAKLTSIPRQAILAASGAYFSTNKKKLLNLLYFLDLYDEIACQLEYRGNPIEKLANPVDLVKETERCDRQRVFNPVEWGLPRTERLDERQMMPHLGSSIP